MADQTTDGKTVRFLTVIDEYTRQGLWIECARHLTSVDVVRVLEQLVELHGAPTAIKSDNGRSSSAKKVQEWIAKRADRSPVHRPRQPVAERSQRELQRRVPRRLPEPMALRVDPGGAREASESWLQEYNEERPHGSLGGDLRPCAALPASALPPRRTAGSRLAAHSRKPLPASCAILGDQQACPSS